MPTFAEKHRVLLLGLGYSAGIGFVIALVGQSLVPSLAKLPGYLLCGSEGFELVLRRRTSYGQCGGGESIHYVIVTLVSALVWTVVCSPIGVLLARGSRR